MRETVRTRATTTKIKEQIIIARVIFKTYPISALCFISQSVLHRAVERIHIIWKRWHAN